MTEPIYPWQQTANQGFELYGKTAGKTVIGPGSREAIDRGVNLFASDNNPVRLAVAQKDIKLPNLWDGGYNHARPGDVVMTYGPQSTEYMASDWQKHAYKYGRSTLIDRNLSVAPSVMESTYVDAKTGEYLTGRLGPDSKEIITGYKRANTGFAFLPEGTPVLSTEAKAAGKAPVLSKPFDLVALDKEGCYLTKTKGVLKKYKGVDAFSDKVYASLKKAFGIAQKSEAYLAAGEISSQASQKAVKNAWKIVVALASKGKIKA